MSSNRLARERSPYLQSASHQPVDWYPWGEEAFARARAEDRPMLLDIGAVWCHWCHVIDRESYDDAETAALINELFVPVKVDRDERPDVDRRYQEAVGAITGQGGWPLTGFLTPDGKVFFGGTYFPPDDAHGRPGFKSVLRQVGQFWQTRRDTALRQADELFGAIQQAMSGRARPAATLLTSALTDEVVRQCTRAFDERYGGFGTQPKFPHTGAIELLIQREWERPDPTMRQIIDTTLTGMGRGGVYDQVGQGFHRYSVDQKWIVPHFEKMSYDNSELLNNYVEGWQLTGDPFYREIAEGIIAWTEAVMTDRERGGFYASQDADINLEDDGDYFTWTVDEVQAVVTEDEFRALRLHYDIHEHGEMHHNPAKNVLHCAIAPTAVAKLLDRSEDEVRARLASGRRKLAAARALRPTPFIDTTIYGNWNAMYVAAYLRAVKAFTTTDPVGAASLQAFALKTLDRLLREYWSDSHGFAHTAPAPDGPPPPPLADDQLQMAWALLEAHEVTGARRYLEAAHRAVEFARARFWDEEQGGFFDCVSDDQSLGMLGARCKAIQDSPNPSTNGVAGRVLARLHHLTGERQYLEQCERLLRCFAETAARSGLYAATYFLALEEYLRSPCHVVIVGETRAAAGAVEFSPLLGAALATYRPGKIVQQFTRAELNDPSLPASVRGMAQAGNAESGPLAFVCAGEVCAPPTADADELRQLIATFGR